jgi:hypothetical protein
MNQTMLNANSIRPELVAEGSSKSWVNKFVIEFMHQWT